MMKKEVTSKNAMGSAKRISNEKRGNPRKRKDAHQKRPLMKKEATQKNAKGLITTDIR
jgi:hypothetical protein